MSTNTLLDVVSELASADPAATIYAAEPVAPNSAAMVCVEPEDGGSPAGFAYLLEVNLARDVLNVWAQWRDDREPSLDDAARAIIYYAERDAYEPVEPID